MTRIIKLALILTVLFPYTSLAYRTSPLEIDVFGKGAESVKFSGWCEIEIGNRTLARRTFSGHDDMMPTIRAHGGYIDSCEITNDSKQGSITLVLRQKQTEFFRRTTQHGEMIIRYGPTMKRYSSKPVVSINQPPLK